MRCSHLLRLLLAPLRDRRAATAIEYGLICVLIAVGAIVAIRGLGTEVVKTWSNVGSSVREAQ